MNWIRPDWSEPIAYVPDFTQQKMPDVVLDCGKLEWLLFYAKRVELSHKAHLFLLQGGNLSDLFTPNSEVDSEIETPNPSIKPGHFILSGGQSFIPYKRELSDVRVVNVQLASMKHIEDMQKLLGELASYRNHIPVDIQDVQDVQ